MKFLILVKYTFASEQSTKDLALKDFSLKFKDFYQKASDNIGILQSESNNLFLVCSEELFERLQKYSLLASNLKAIFDLQFEIINKLKTVEELLNIQGELEKHKSIIQNMFTLAIEIKKLMREEIGFYKET